MSIAGAFVALGIITLGYRVIQTIGSDLAELNFHMGFSIEMASTLSASRPRPQYCLRAPSIYLWSLTPSNRPALAPALCPPPLFLTRPHGYVVSLPQVVIATIVGLPVSSTHCQARGVMPGRRARMSAVPKDAAQRPNYVAHARLTRNADAHDSRRSDRQPGAYTSGRLAHA